jgi:hypothetical protein
MIALVGNFVCKALLVINISGLPWTEHDTGVLKRNQNFCERKLPNSPCMREFRKTAEQTYFILCGKETN